MPMMIRSRWPLSRKRLASSEPCMPGMDWSVRRRSKRFWLMSSSAVVALSQTDASIPKAWSWREIICRLAGWSSTTSACKDRPRFKACLETNRFEVFVCLRPELLVAAMLVRGNATQKWILLPKPGALSKKSWLSMEVTRWFVIVKPRPVPFTCSVLPGNCSKAWSAMAISSVPIPMPVSIILNSMSCPAWSSASTLIEK